MAARAIVPPNWRKKVSAAVACPIFVGNAFCTINVYSAMPKPKPRPSTSMASNTSLLVALTSRRTSSNVPATLTSIPKMAIHLYLPRRETNCPETILPTTEVSNNGVERRSMGHLALHPFLLSLKKTRHLVSRHAILFYEPRLMQLSQLGDYYAMPRLRNYLAGWNNKVSTLRCIHSGRGAKVTLRT